MNGKKVKKLRKIFREQYGNGSTEPIYNMSREVVEPNTWRQFKKKYSNLSNFS